MIHFSKIAGIVLVVSAGVAGCSSGSDTKDAGSSPTVSATAVVSSGAPGAASSQAPGSAKVGSGKAVNLPLSADLRRLLGDVYYTATKKEPKDDASGVRRDKVIGPEHVLYGKITGSSPAGDVFYAAGDTGYTDDPTSRQDGPHVWRKRGADGWVYLGDTGGALCGMVPRALVQVWGKAC